MALMMNEEFQFKTVQDAFEQAGLLFSRLSILANTAIVINDYKDGDFKDPLYRQDCLHYQLEAIRDLGKQFEDVFGEVAMTLGRPVDALRRAAERGQPEPAELLPENAGQAVLAAAPGACPIHPPIEPTD